MMTTDKLVIHCGDILLLVTFRILSNCRPFLIFFKILYSQNWRWMRERLSIIGKGMIVLWRLRSFVPADWLVSNFHQSEDTKREQAPEKYFARAIISVLDEFHLSSQVVLIYIRIVFRLFAHNTSDFLTNKSGTFFHFINSFHFFLRTLLYLSHFTNFAQHIFQFRLFSHKLNPYEPRQLSWIYRLQID